MSDPGEFFVEVQNYGRDFLLNCASSQLTRFLGKCLGKFKLCLERIVRQGFR